MAIESTRARLLAGQFIVVGVLAAGFGMAMFQFVEVLEQQLIHARLADQIRVFTGAYRQNPRIAPPSAQHLQGYVARAGADPAGIPAELAPLAPGFHQEVPVAGRELDVAVADVGPDRLYVTLDVAPIERLESLLITIAGGTFLGACVVAGLASWKLADYVLDPVSDLADRFARLDPGQRGVRLPEQDGDATVRRISAGLNGYLQRLDDFVEREQAFTGDVSHELRTPLAIILSAAHLLGQEKTLSPPAVILLGRIRRAAQGMGELIEAMLFLARENGGARAGTCALNDVVGEVVNQYQSVARDRGLDLTYRAASPQMVAAPAAMVNCVISNLVGNAVAHGGPGSVSVVLSPGLLTVDDTGPGIPANDLGRVFERGYRGPGSRGSGLGLSLVKRICDRLGWRIRLSSRVGEGTSVELHFASPGVVMP